jgi:hypothetical protein
MVRFSRLTITAAGFIKSSCLKLAVRLRAATTVTVKWIAQRLRMGTWTHLLYWHRRERSK